MITASLQHTDTVTTTHRHRHTTDTVTTTHRHRHNNTLTPSLQHTDTRTPSHHRHRHTTDTVTTTYRHRHTTDTVLTICNVHVRYAIITKAVSFISYHEASLIWKSQNTNVCTI